MPENKLEKTRCSIHKKIELIDKFVTYMVQKFYSAIVLVAVVILYLFFDNLLNVLWPNIYTTSAAKLSSDILRQKGYFESSTFQVCQVIMAKPNQSYTAIGAQTGAYSCRLIFLSTPCVN